MKGGIARGILGGVVLMAIGCAHQAAPLRLSEMTGYAGTKQATHDGQRYLRNRFCQELLLRFGVAAYDDADPTDAMNACLADDGGESYPRDSFSIALSGGGTRSASFAMGVLKALNDDGLLEQADAISSVSGGGYTSYWLTSQRFYNSMKLDDSHHYDRNYYREVLAEMARAKSDQAIAGLPFCQHLAKTPAQTQMADFFRARIDGDILTPEIHQRHIAAQSDIINYTRSPTGQKLESAGLLATHIVSLPLYWVTDGFLNTGLYNGSVFTNAYRKGLERTYGLSPNPKYNYYVDYFEHEPSQYHNARNGTFLFWRKASQTEELQFSHLREFSLAYNTCGRALANQNIDIAPVTMPIINTKLTRPYSFFPDDGNFDMASLEKSVFTFTPLQWGSAHTQYHPEQELWAPVPFSKAIALSGAALDEGARQARGLADFGLSAVNANLGYEIRNPTTQKSPAGSAWFYTYKLIGGFPLKFLVRENWQATLRLSDGGHNENLGLYSLIERGTRRIIVVDAEHDPDYTFESLKRVQANLKANQRIELHCVGPCPLAGDYIQRQGVGVFELTAKGFPWSEPSQIIYVKLSINERLLADSLKDAKNRDCLRSLTVLQANSETYPCNVSRYYDGERGNTNAFPHNSTADVWYSEGQYEAYRDLAYFIGKTQLLPKMKNWSTEVREERAAARGLVEGRYRGAAVSQ